jgi:hypothetical protein
MLNLKECKELIDDSNLSNEEILEIRDACYELAEIAFDHIESLLQETSSTETHCEEPSIQPYIPLSE